jgi:hypothetical protein
MLASSAIAAERQAIPYAEKIKPEMQKSMDKENCEKKYVALRTKYPPKSEDVVKKAMVVVFPECSKARMVYPPEPPIAENQLAPRIPKEWPTGLVKKP